MQAEQLRPTIEVSRFEGFKVRANRPPISCVSIRAPLNAPQSEFTCIKLETSNLVTGKLGTSQHVAGHTRPGRAKPAPRRRSPGAARIFIDYN